MDELLCSLLQCEVCPLNPTPGSKLSPALVPGQGPEKCDIALVGEAPGQNEALSKLPFVGQAGKLLDLTLRVVGLNRQDLWITNTCMCRPPQNRTPLQVEISACNARLIEELRLREVKLVYAMGGTALKALTGSTSALGTVRGTPFWNETLEAYIVPTYHPAAILRDYEKHPDLITDLRKWKKMLELPQGGVPTFIEGLEELHLDSEDMAIHFLHQLTDAVEEYPEIALDLECTGFDFMNDRILELGFCWKPNKAAILPARFFTDEVRKALIRLFESNHIFIWHNGKFDTRFLIYQWKIPVELLPKMYQRDTMLMHYALDERQGTHSLKMLARDLCGGGWYEEELKKYLPNSKTPFDAVPEPLRWTYLAHDVHYTRMLNFILKARCEREVDAWKLHNETLMPAARTFATSEMEGVTIDLEARASLQAFLESERDRLQVELTALAEHYGGTLTNAQSTQQLSTLLYDVMHFPLFDGRKTTEADAMERYSKHPFVAKLLEFREVTKLLGTYVKGLAQHIKQDGKVHPDVLAHATLTGRLAIHDPPLQTIPRKRKEIKKLFVAQDEDHVVAEYDYDQLEIRTATWYSGDAAMLDGFTKPLEITVPVTDVGNGLSISPLPEIVMSERFSQPIYSFMDNPAEVVYQYKADFHTRGAAAAFNMPWVKLTEDDRYNYKFVIFGVLYGRGADSLANDPQGLINATVRQAQAYIDGLWRSFPDLKRWIEDMEAEVKRTGYLVTPFGRRRRFPVISQDTWWKIAKQIRNFPCQSTASDICLSAWVRLDRELRARQWGSVLFGVHDSLLFHLRKDRVADAHPLIVDVMGNPPYLEDRGVKWEVDGKVGQSWGSAIPVEKWLAQQNANPMLISS